MTNIFSFGDEIEKHLQTTRYVGQGEQHSAGFQGVRVVGEDDNLRHIYGYGDSPDNAIEDYVTKISGRLLFLESEYIERHTVNQTQNTGK
jgi:hypothetical protein